MNYAGLGSLGMTEICVIAGVAVLLFGGRKIAELGKGLGEGIGNFKKALKAGKDTEPVLRQEGREIKDALNG